MMIAPKRHRMADHRAILELGPGGGGMYPATCSARYPRLCWILTRFSLTGEVLKVAFSCHSIRERAINIFASASSSAAYGIGRRVFGTTGRSRSARCSAISTFVSLAWRRITIAWRSVMTEFAIFCGVQARSTTRPR